MSDDTDRLDDDDIQTDLRGGNATAATDADAADGDASDVDASDGDATDAVDA